ncbi:MAG TPA: calcium-binding protein, partial [Allosphingosinicella sp.]|nr:calcium-binding protein [Allosphingosinicella sp.]
MPQFVGGGRYVAFDVTTASQPYAEQATLIGLAGGRMLLAWNLGGELRGQIYDSNGSAAGSSFVLNTDRAYTPSVSALPGGGFVASWEGSVGDRFVAAAVRIFDSAGNPAGAPFAANSTTAFAQQPTVAVLAGGGFVVSWTQGDSSGSGIMMRRFDAGGNPVGAEVQVNTVFGSNQYYPLTVALSNGGFVIAWIDSGHGMPNEPDQPSYSAQYFDAAGNRVGGEIEIAPFNQTIFDIVALASGDVVAVTPTASGELEGRIVGSGGVVGAAFQINPPTAAGETMPEIAALPSGGFMVTWRVDTPEVNYFQKGDVWAQLFDGQGAKLGDAFLVNSVTASGQTEPQIAAFGTNDLAIVYQDFDESGQPSLRMRLLYSAEQGTAGNDVMNGGDGRDFFYGLGGNDVLDGAAGDDELDGGDNDDILVGGAGRDNIVGGLGNDRLYSHAVDPAYTGPTSFIGTSYDTFAEADTLSGGAGDDYLFAGYGDHVDGGANDTFGDRLFISFRGATSGVNGDFRMLIDQSSVTVGGGTITGIEYADFIEGSEFGDLLATYGSFYPGQTRVYGFGGDDRLIAHKYAGFGGGGFWGGEGDDTIDAILSDYGPALYGESGDDILIAGTSGSIVDGGTGNDILHLSSGNQTARGGEGDDSFYFLQSLDDLDRVDGGDGFDRVFVSGGFAHSVIFGATSLVNVELLTLAAGFGYQFRMSDGNLAAGQTLIVDGSGIPAGLSLQFDGSAEQEGGFDVTGGAGADTLVGGSGADVLNGGAGVDTLRGRSGNDVYHVDSASDQVLENSGEGTDEVRTSLASASLAAYANVENLTGTSATAQSLTGNSGNNVVTGGSASDVLRLYDGGDDVANGGAGNDTLFFIGSLTAADVVVGGDGADTLVIQGPYGSLALSANVTQIENVSILAGNNINFGEPGTNRYDYVLTTNDANFAAGVQSRINGAALLEGEDFTFDGSAETDAKYVVYGGKGKDTLTGGLGADIFFYAEERFASGDVVNGGAGYDGMFLRGNYTIDFTAPG